MMRALPCAQEPRAKHRQSKCHAKGKDANDPDQFRVRVERSQRFHRSRVLSSFRFFRKPEMTFVFRDSLRAFRRTAQ
jgi:hypothetical protein